MVFSTFTAVISSCLLILLTPVLASPIEPRQAPATYYLQTSSNDTSKDGLYVYAYHTGAGLNDAVLTPNISIASEGYLNGTYQSFNLSDGLLAWDMDMDGEANYGRWEYVRINVGTGADGFYINDGGLQWDADYGFGGWLACDWYHDSPQLFWIVSYYNSTFPCSCAVVNLTIVEV